MAELFIWVPSKTIPKKSKINLTVAKFGSGYSQRIRHGTVSQQEDSWDLEFINQPVDVANNIISFLEDKSGVDYFLFTPLNLQKTFKCICTEWSETYTSGFSKTITAVFNRVYDIN